MPNDVKNNISFWLIKKKTVSKIINLNLKIAIAWANK